MSSVKLKIISGEEMIISEFDPQKSFRSFEYHVRDLIDLKNKQHMTMKWIDEEGDPCMLTTTAEYDEAYRLYKANEDAFLEVHVFPSIPLKPGEPCATENYKMYRRGAKRRKKFYYLLGHKFAPKRFNATATCVYCNSRIWGLGQQGLKCSECRLALHKRCMIHVKHKCGESYNERPNFNSGVNNEGFTENGGRPSTGMRMPTYPEDSNKSNTRSIITQETEGGTVGRVGLQDFQLLRVIGRGSYAKVFQVRYKATGRIYAMKVVKKELITSEDDIDWVQTEKQVFERATNHPFLVGLHSSFQTPSRLFFVIEFVNGGDLMYYMQRQLRLPEDYARFYSAEIAVALNFLHERHIIYRDLKLDNVLMDSEGHIKLTDYGMCKDGISPDMLTSTFCGTPNYIAPEILNTRQYNYSVDWWALGVLMFEMLAGRSPWEGVGHSENPDQNTEEYLFQVILERPIRYPRSISVTATKILKAFLQKEPEERLGCAPNSNFSEIMRHPFFRPIDWTALENKQIMPPYRPIINDDVDTSQFDPTFTEEPVQFTPDNESMIRQLDQSEFDGFEYINPLLMAPDEFV